MHRITRKSKGEIGEVGKFVGVKPGIHPLTRNRLTGIASLQSRAGQDRLMGDAKNNPTIRDPAMLPIGETVKVLNTPAKNRLTGKHTKRKARGGGMLPLNNQEVVCERLVSFTRRELEVYELLLAGKQNKEIASSLRFSVRTAAFHVSNILRKLRVSSRVEILARNWQRYQ